MAMGKIKPIIRFLNYGLICKMSRTRYLAGNLKELENSCNYKITKNGLHSCIQIKLEKEFNCLQSMKMGFKQITSEKA